MTPVFSFRFEKSTPTSIFQLQFFSETSEIDLPLFFAFDFFFLFAAFRFDEKRHPIRKVSASPVSADSALAIFHSEREIGEEFSDSVTTRSVSDDVRKGSHDQAADINLNRQLFEKAFRK